jgi:hypothetical protein
VLTQVLITLLSQGRNLGAGKCVAIVKNSPLVDADSDACEEILFQTSKSKCTPIKQGNTV